MHGQRGRLGANGGIVGKRDVGGIGIVGSVDGTWGGGSMGRVDVVGYIRGGGRRVLCSGAGLAKDPLADHLFHQGWIH